MRAAKRERLLYDAWSSGNLDYLLDSNQRSLLFPFRESAGRKYVWNCSRQIGKSFGFVNDAIAYSLENPGSEVKYAAPTAKAVKKIIRPHFRFQLRECPREFRPTFHTQDGEWRFPNGSVITIAGCDRDNAEALRGQHLHRAYVDEAGFIGDLRYVLDDILMPQTLNTRGRILIGSTPAKTPGHHFKKVCDDAEANGCYQHRTIYENPRITEKDIADVMKEAGGPESTTWKREYLAQHVTDEESAVIPEATDARIREITREVPRAPFYDAYAGIDVGWAPDMTGLLWGWYWFEEATLVIEDEFLMRKLLTSELAKTTKEKEEQLFPKGKHVFRFGDIEKRLQADLAETHRLHFIPTDKQDRETAINHLRLMVIGANGKLLIHPRCKRLRVQLKNATWQKNRIEFERTEEDGHYDLVAALIYLARNILRHKNPVPPGYGLSESTHFISPEVKHPTSSAARTLRSAFTFGGE